MAMRRKSNRTRNSTYGRCPCGGGANVQLSVGINKSVFFVDGCKECVTNAGIILIMSGLVWVGEVATHH